MTAADGARSAETLGKERRGSGVVIGPDGLILTIGYLMVEAQTIEVVRHPPGGVIPRVASSPGWRHPREGGDQGHSKAEALVSRPPPPRGQASRE